MQIQTVLWQAAITTPESESKEKQKKRKPTQDIKSFVCLLIFIYLEKY